MHVPLVTVQNKRHKWLGLGIESSKQNRLTGSLAGRPLSQDV
jgi:hypothetical protein